jgi:hypothetical protein
MDAKRQQAPSARGAVAVHCTSLSSRAKAATVLRRRRYLFSAPWQGQCYARIVLLPPPLEEVLCAHGLREGGPTTRLSTRWASGKSPLPCATLYFAHFCACDATERNDRATGDIVDSINPKTASGYGGSNYLSLAPPAGKGSSLNRAMQNRIVFSR